MYISFHHNKDTSNKISVEVSSDGFNVNYYDKNNVKITRKHHLVRDNLISVSVG